MNRDIYIRMLSVTVTIVGNGTGNLCSNPGRGCFRFTTCECSWEKHESISSLLRVNSWGNCVFVWQLVY